MKVAQSLAALIAAGAFAVPVFVAGTASAPIATPAPATTAAATTTDAVSVPEAGAKHEKKHVHKKVRRATAKPRAKTDSASVPKVVAPAKQ